MPTVFVSHASPDRATIEQTILPLLRAHDIRYWYSSENIPSASDWEKVIRRALTDCDWFLVALSANAIQSEWVQAEVHWALDHRRNHFVSLLLTDCTPSDLHLKLIRYQHVDFRQPNDEANRRLVEALGVAYQNPLSLLIEYCIGGVSEKVRTLVVNETTFIGSASDSAILLSDPYVSRRHGLLKVRICGGEKSIWLSDLGTMNGILLNGIRVKESVELKPGDRIVVGSSEVTVLLIRDI